MKNYQPAWFIQDGAPKKAKLPYKWLNYDLLPIKLNQFITGHHPVGPFFTAGKWVISDDCDGFWMCFGLDKHGDFLWKMMIFGRCFTGRWMEREGFPVWVARFPRIIAKLHLRNTRPGLQVNQKTMERSTMLCSRENQLYFYGHFIVDFPIKNGGSFHYKWWKSIISMAIFNSKL